MTIEYVGIVRAETGDTAGMVKASWDDPADPAIVGYEVQWTHDDAYWNPEAQWTSTGVTITGLEASIDTGSTDQVWVRVRAIGVDGPQAQWWEAADAWPGGLELTANPVLGAVRVSWPAVTSQTRPVTGYVVSWKDYYRDWTTTNVTVSGTTARIPVPRDRAIDVRVQVMSGDAATMTSSIYSLQADSLYAEAEPTTTPGSFRITWDAIYGKAFKIQWAPVSAAGVPGAWRSTGVRLVDGQADVQTPYAGRSIAWRILGEDGDVLWWQEWQWIYLDLMPLNVVSGPKPKQLSVSWTPLPAGIGVTGYRVDRMVNGRYVSGAVYPTGRATLLGYSGERICLRLVVLVGSEVASTQEMCGQAAYDPQAPNPHRPAGNGGGAAIPPSNGRGDTGKYGYTLLGQRISLDATGGIGNVREGFMDESTVKRSWDPDRDGRSEHNGVDIAADSGTPVYTTVAGQVTASGNCRCWAGIQVIVTMPTGAQVTYAHMSATSVTVGMRVSTGTRVGSVGSTGNSYGSHLHVSVVDRSAQWVVDGYTDPAPFMDIAPSARTVAAAYARKQAGRTVASPGLVHTSYRRGGVRLPTTVTEQRKVAAPIKKAALIPGDLVFFGKAGRVTSVGIYLGNGQVAHAPRATSPVRIASLSDTWQRTYFAGAGRVRI